MARRMFARLGLLMGVGVLAGWQATPALANWKLNSTSRASVAYNQGIAFDQAHGNFFFDGVSSTSNSALYRTNSTLSRTASNTAVIPTDPQANPQGYNHAGDLSFDPVNVSITDTGNARVRLPLECYYPDRTPSNTCGSGAFGVVDPATLSFLYYVKLWTPQIKAMWNEITPDGHWIFTSGGTHLLAYNAADINKQRADNQLQGVWGGLGGKDLGPVLATSNVSGAAFYVVSGIPRLFLALNRGTYFQVVSYGIGTASDGTPVLLSSTPTVEISVNQSSSNNEAEGLATAGLFGGSYPLGSVLHWQMLPSIKLYSRVLNYTASSGASSGSLLAPRCTVPNLKNHTLKQATTLLGAAHCRLGKVSAKQTSRTRRGKVIAQQPKPAGARRAARSRVSVVVGLRLPQPLVAQQPTSSRGQESRKRRADRPAWR